MQPQLSLNYNSQLIDLNIAGVGWSVNGLSLIYRCGATIAPDGYKGGVNLDYNDRFCLDGEHLMVVNGSYGVAGSEYRTQHETWQKVIASGASGRGPASFTVYAKDGSIRQYGVTTDSRVLGVGQPEARVWALNRIQDRNGNYITISYTQDTANGDFRPATISYTGNVNTGTVPNNFVYFTYVNRPDLNPRFEGGTLAQVMTRLTNVKTYTGLTLVREYRLAYDNNGAVGRSRLTSVTECGTDGVCLPATSFSYQNGGSVGFGSSVNSTWISAGTISNRWFSATDFNADGKIDLLVYDPASGNLSFSAANGSGSYGAIVTSYFIAGGSPTDRWFSVADINGDGVSDAVLYQPGSGNISVALASGSGGFAPAVNSYLATGGSPADRWFVMGDQNGDGRADAFLYTPSTGYLSVSLANGTATFASPVNTYIGTGGSPSDRWFYATDVDGDGKTDVLMYQPSTGNVTVWLSIGNGNFTTSVTTYLVSGGSPSDRWFTMADVNGDGRADAVLYTHASGYVTVWLSNSNGRFAPPANSYLGSGGSPADRWFTLDDINGDGWADAVLYQPATGYVTTAVSTGSGGLAAPVSTYFVAGGSPSDRWFSIGDTSGDGKRDLVMYSPANGAVSNALANAPIADLLSSITDGVGAKTNITYKPITDSAVYVKYTGAVYPYQNIQNAMYVVYQSSQSNGIGGWYSINYKYENLQRHALALSSLGFRYTWVYDNQTGLKTVSGYLQDYNGTEGAPEFTQVFNPSWATIKHVFNTWAPMSPPLGQGRTMALLNNTVDQTWELNGSFIGKVTTSYGYDSYGNPTSALVNYNNGYTQNSVTAYQNDTTSWILGLPTSIQLTKQTPSGTSPTLTSTFSYYPGTSLVQTEIKDPDRPTLMVTTSNSYDSYGNQLSITTSGPDIVARTESQAFDTQGRFITSKTNALGHKTLYNTYDARTGSVTNATDPNGLVTLWEFNDGFGRMTKETRADSSATTLTYARCGIDTTCPALAVTAVATALSGAGTSWFYRDVLNRQVRQAAQGYGGAWVYMDTSYDSWERKNSVSNPYYGGGTLRYTTYGYDTLGRVTSVTVPGNRTTTTTYNGLTTTITNALNQNKTTVKNMLGQIVQASDAGGTTNYQYDTLGNLSQVTDVSGNVSTMSYDVRGRKLAMYDPDMGSWSNTYDVLGEPKSQTDAKAQTATMTYDKLGRMLTRTTPEGTGTWVYDTATKGIGKLAQTSNGAAVVTYAYDSLSRPTTANTSISGTTYTATTTYDTYSRVDTVTYPETGFKLRHVYDPYQLGLLKEVVNGTTGASYWKTNTSGVDALNRIITETDGSGLITLHQYNDQNNDLVSIKTGTSATPTSVQNQTYGFDELGNVTARSWWDGTAQRSETFGYDTLNRLTTVTGPANKTYAYAPNGNITFKTSVGTYTYPTNGIRPHAVSSIAGSINTSFTYDANGNRLTGNGLTFTYTSFNKPKTIVKGTSTTTLTYDASFNRLIKSNSSGTTVYIGKLYERVTSGTTTTQKHHIYAGPNLVGTYSKLNNGTSNTRYFHTDLLGSVDTITNETGGVVQRLSYDAWGKRRNASGTDATTITAQTTRGFTRHEHDDEVGLVNMNAREFDPLLGRFATPDTIIQFPLSSQGMNRYTYVNDNPLSFTDPTGHWRISIGSISIGSGGISIGNTSVSWGDVACLGCGQVVDAGPKIVDNISNSIGNVFTNVVSSLSQVNYVGGLLTTGFLANPMFGPAYGATTGDWRSVARATATAAVLAAGVWAGGAMSQAYAANPGWFTGAVYIGGSAELGYASGYSIAKINGASSADARAAGLSGARMSAVMASLYVGYEAVAGMTPEQASNSENTIGSRRGSDNVGRNLTCLEGGASCSQKLYDANLGIQATSRIHDPMTGSAGVGFRPPSSELLRDFVNLPIVGDAYNIGTMPIAFLWTQGAYAANLGISPALIWLQQPMNAGE